jgi:methionyl-tRNA synthetase
MQYYEQREYGKAMREIMLLAEHANTFINDAEPWVKIKDPEQVIAVQQICTVGLNYFRIIVTYLSPVLPAIASKTEQFLNTTLTLESLEQPLFNHAINRYRPMMTRVEPAQIEKILEETKAGEPAAITGRSMESGPEQATDAHPPEPLKPEIDIDDFNKVDLRVAVITDAQPVEGADKLIQLTLDIGLESRTVFAGIKAAYAPADLIGRTTVMVANLKPRKMRFGLSSGMVLAAGPGGHEIFILTPDEGAQPGMRVK